MHRHAATSARTDLYVAPPSTGGQPDLGWSDLCVSLIAEFPEVSSGEVIEEVARARSATELFGLSPAEQLRTSASIARNNLMIASGGADLARLDPERHMRRKHGDD